MIDQTFSPLPTYAPAASPHAVAPNAYIPTATTTTTPAASPVASKAPISDKYGGLFNSFLRKPYLLMGGVLILLALVIISPLLHQQTISTIGLARQNFPIDRAEMTLFYVSQTSSPTSIKESSMARVNNVVSELSAAGATNIVSSVPQVVPQTLGGMQYRQTIELEANDAETVSKLLSLLKNRELIISSARYMTKDETTAQSTLLEKSTANAREKADLLAKDQSLKITGVKEITEIESSVETGSSLSSDGSGDAAISDGFSGQTRLLKTINATYYVRKKILGIL